MVYTQLFNGLNDIKHTQNRGVSLDPIGCAYSKLQIISLKFYIIC